MAGVAGRSGGARPGSGPKPKREKHASAINRAEKRIADRLPELIDRLFELAEGVTVREFGLDGSPRVYDKPPDFKAASYLADRVMGKPVTPTEVSGPGGDPVTVKVISGVKMSDL